jgi:hypothetical protein
MNAREIVTNKNFSCLDFFTPYAFNKIIVQSVQRIEIIPTKLTRVKNEPFCRIISNTIPKTNNPSNDKYFHFCVTGLCNDLEKKAKYKWLATKHVLAKVRRAKKVVDAIANKEYAQANAINAQNQYDSELLSFSDLTKGVDMIDSPHKIRADAKKNNSFVYCIVT